MTRAITDFRDKFTGVIYPAGSSYNGERTEELAKAGFLKKEAKARLKRTG